jgi:RNA-directed DNA polymerase
MDLDPEKFFDRVDHDVLMGRLARRVGYKRLLRIVWCYLQAGMLKQGGVCHARRRDSTGWAAVPLAG